MRTRALVVATLLVLPVALTAQVRPRGRAPTTTQAPLPPQAPVVAQALAYKRSRWSTEGYSLINSVSMPSGGNYSTVGAGTHADYRFATHFSGTVDMTSTIPMGTSNSQSGELGMRYSPLDFDQRVRPFFDVRGVYMRMTDVLGTTATVGSADAVLPGSRYTRGLGAFGGVGAEYSITSRFAFTTELSALRSHMSTYRITTSPSAPLAAPFSMTMVRFAFGLKFNPVTALHMGEKSAP